MRSKYQKLKRILGLKGGREKFIDMMLDFFLRNLNEFEIKNNFIELKSHIEQDKMLKEMFEEMNNEKK